MNSIYFGTTENGLIEDYMLRYIAFILTGERIAFDDNETLKEFAKKCKGIRGEVKNPSVKYLVKNGYKVEAMKLYRDKHPGTSLKEAKEIIDAMEEKIKREIGENI